MKLLKKGEGKGGKGKKSSNEFVNYLFSHKSEI